MGLFDDVQVPVAGVKPVVPSTEKKEKVQTKFWLNVGVERNGKLLTLPLGIPLDGLTAKSIPNGKASAEFRGMRIAEKQLWDKIQEVMSTLKPGESKSLPLQVEIRHVEAKELTAEEAASNPFALGDLSF
jgi:hypothetical protein